MAGQRRRWGWHQLHPRSAAQLVADADLPAGALVVDIGAGTGAITAPLVDAGMRVVAFEVHDGRARALGRRFAGDVKVVRADAADLRLPRRPFHVVASPPYGISTAVLRRLLHPGSRMVSAHLILQEQAARRWVGPGAPGAARWMPRYETALGRRIPRRAFTPPPRVDSRVLVIRRRR